MKLTLLRRRTLVWALLFAYLPACTSWHVVGPTPAEYVQSQRPGRIQVIRTDSSRVRLRRPAILGDTLVGTVGGGLVRGDTAHQVRVALGDVRAVEVRELSIGKTLGLCFGVSLVLALIASGQCYGYGC